MAALATHDVNHLVSSHSRSSGASSRSFSSWGSRRRPRDSLERLREREENEDNTQLSSIRNLPVPELSVQQVGRGERLLVKGTKDAELHGAPLDIPRHAISRGVICERYPKGKASLLIFIFNMIVSYAFGAAVTGILNIFHIEKDGGDLNQTVHLLFTFLQLLFQFCISRMFYPIAGFIADVYIGRCKMIKVSLVLLTFGYLLLVAAFLIGGQSRIDIKIGSQGRMLIDSIRIVAFLLISAGGGAFEATSIPFGVDQLQGASSSEISSYFYFFYFSRNLGMILGIIIYSLVMFGSLKINSVEFHNYLDVISTEAHTNELYGVFQPLVTLVILSVGLILMICLHHWFFKNLLWENPVKLIAKILCYAATVKRHLPIRNRAFRYGEERKKRIELAKITYDGKFHDEKVEDVKAFCQILLILISLTPTMFSINAFNTILLHETKEVLTHHHPNQFLQLILYPSIFFGVQSLLILFILPIINFLVVPFCPKLTIRARIGIGVVLYSIGNVLVVAIHAFPLINNNTKVSDTQLGFLLIPMIIFGVAEVLTIVSVLEFIYAQSPESMKGLLTGLFYLMLGLTSILSSGTLYGYYHNMYNQRLVMFHSAFTVIQALGIVFYGVVALLHKNRVRPDGDSSTRHQQRLMIENQLHVSIIANT